MVPATVPASAVSVSLLLAGCITISSHATAGDAAAAPAKEDERRPPATCNLLTGHDIYCHNATRGGKGPKGHYAVWCDDLVQVPCSSGVGEAKCDACDAPRGCQALCVRNATDGGACTAWSYIHQHKLCFLKGLADYPANVTYMCANSTGKPAASADTSGRLWKSDDSEEAPPLPPRARQLQLM